MGLAAGNSRLRIGRQDLANAKLAGSAAAASVAEDGVTRLSGASHEHCKKGKKSQNPAHVQITSLSDAGCTGHGWVGVNLPG
jgi:hypothetical protein